MKSSAIYGLWCVGCVLPSAEGRIFSRPIENQYRFAVLKNAHMHANEPVIIRSWKKSVSQCPTNLSVSG